MPSDASFGAACFRAVVDSGRVPALSLKHRNSKLEAIHEQFNLFDVRDEKKKFSVVTRSGREEGGAKGMPGKARAAGIESVRVSLSSTGATLTTVDLH